jgi:hypothetical protein
MFARRNSPHAKTARTPRETPQVAVSRQVMVFDPESASRVDGRPGRSSQIGHTPRRAKRITRTNEQTPIATVRRHESPPVAPPQPRRRADDPMTRTDIENMRKMINSAQPRTTYWADTSNCMFNEKCLTDISSPEEVRPRSIIVDTQPIDINVPPQAARLISTTASVLDYIGVPNSLSFIR